MLEEQSYTVGLGGVTRRMCGLQGLDGIGLLGHAYLVASGKVIGQHVLVAVLLGHIGIDPQGSAVGAVIGIQLVVIGQSQEYMVLTVLPVETFGGLVKTEHIGRHRIVIKTVPVNGVSCGVVYLEPCSGHGYVR